MKHIVINNQKLINITKVGRSNIYTLADNTTIFSRDFISVETECPTCLAIKPLKKLHDYNLKKASECNRCKCLGLKNPFYGKRHNNKTKKKISKKNKKRFVGSKNPMYGISLLEHWTNKYGEKIANIKNKEYLIKLSISLSGYRNPFYGKKHNKRAIKNIQQKNNMKRDKDKIKFAQKHGMKLYHIWESDIRSHNFSILEDIKNEIYIRANN